MERARASDNCFAHFRNMKLYNGIAGAYQNWSGNYILSATDPICSYHVLSLNEGEVE
jgi:hypothetical protein